MRKRQLAVSDSDCSDDDDDIRRPAPTKFKSSKAKGKSRKRDEDSSTDEEEAKSILIENIQAGLKTKTTQNGKGKEKKKKSKEKKKTQAKSNGKGKGKALAISDESEASNGENENIGSFEVSQSEGSLHGSDDEPGLGNWTEEDQRFWQDPKDKDGEYVVDLIIRWRWHPQYHFAQYRVRWEGYSDRDNTWEPMENFNGDDVDNFWKDREFDGVEQRPREWDETEKDVLNRLEARGLYREKKIYNTDTDVYSADGATRRLARKKARRAIRMDRVERREAYGRRRKRDEAEAAIEREKEEKIAEERRRKRREEEKAAKEKLLATSTRKVISHGVKIAGGTSKSSIVAKSQPTLREAAPPPSTPASKSAASPTPASSKQAAALDDRLEYAKKFLPESDAKLKADKKKAKLDEVRPAPAANTSVPKAQVSSTTLTTEEAKATTAEEKTSDTLPRAGTSTAVRGGGPTRGGYRGAHKGRRLTTPWDPLAISSGTTRPNNNGLQAPPHPAPITAPPVQVSEQEAAPSEVRSGWDYDDDPGPVFEQESVPAAEPMHQPQRTLTPAPTQAQPLPQSFFGRGILMGRDPRNRTAQTSSVGPASVRMPGSVSPFGSPTLESPLQPLQSPLHTNQSPKEGQPSGLMSPTTDQATNSEQRGSTNQTTPAERDRAEQVIKRWPINDAIQTRIARSYNFMAARQAPNRDQRRLLESAIRHLGGGLVMTFEAKHKELSRSNTIWVPNSEIALTTVETEALKYENFLFLSYENESIQEIWPYSKGKVVMYTFGALMIKLIEQIFVKKLTQAWTEEEGTSILVHSWQKLVLQQLIDSESVEDYLRQILGIVDDVPDKGFELVVSAMGVLEEMEEVPSELTNTYRQSTDVPNAGDMELEKLTHVLDTEVSQTLHRLQSKWKFEKRVFTLVMAKTRLACREVPTNYLVL